MTRNHLGVAVFILGAVACAVWAISNIQPLFAFVAFFGSGSGGVAEVSVGPFGIEALEAIGAPLIAFALSVLVRKRDGFARSLRRAHIIATVTIALIMILVIGLGIPGLVPLGVVGPESARFMALMLGVALWVPVQGFFASGFLGLLILKRSS
ncbi:MAG TPA: hypothetical protein VKB50_32910 [Vicinamibacterales bacterium]|nr:hypothetical protein [Vicinamibacterales bacterium]